MEIKKEFDVADFLKENLQATDYGHTMAKSHFLCDPNSNPFGFTKGLVFSRNNGCLMRNMDEGLTVLG